MVLKWSCFRDAKIFPAFFQQAKNSIFKNFFVPQKPKKTVQSYCLRKKYDQVVYGEGNYNSCLSCCLAVFCEKCSLAQMNTHLHNSDLVYQTV